MNKNTIWILFQADLIAGAFTSYRKAVQAMAMKATLPITEFESSFDVDFFTDKKGTVWSIQEFEVDNI